jgi:hypothetical protein
LVAIRNAKKEGLELAWLTKIEAGEIAEDEDKMMIMKDGTGDGREREGKSDSVAIILAWDDDHGWEDKDSMDVFCKKSFKSR